MDYKLLLLKKSCTIIALIVTVSLCISFISDIDKSKIITLSASSENSQPENHITLPAEENSQANNQAPVVKKQMNSTVNIVTEAAVKLGVLSCVSRINQVASFLTTNNQTGVFIFKPQSQPDQHIFSTSFELVRNDNSTLYASASFFPNQDAVYDTVEYVNKSCEELEKTTFKNLKRVSVMKKNIILLDSGKVKVFLMPAGSGTVVIKKEVIR